MRYFIVSISLFCLLSLVTRSIAENDTDVAPVDRSDGVYQNSKGQCYRKVCENCRDGGCCDIIVRCPDHLRKNGDDTDVVPIDRKNGIYKNSKGQCYKKVCENCRDGGCCAIIVKCP